MSMATISENLQILKDSADAIKQAIIDKGGTINGDITTWADAINGIGGGGSSSGESSGGAGSVFKITNKLNGQLFGGPIYSNSTNANGEVLHTYTFEGNVLKSATIISIQPIEENGAFPNNSVYGVGTERYVGVETSTYNVKNGRFKCFCNNNGEVLFQTPDPQYESISPLKCMYIAIDINDNYDFDFFYLQSTAACFLKDTLITLSNNTTKPVQDITYNDELLVWNFDEGKYDYAKPLWIKKTQTSTYYYKVTLDNGTILNLVGSDGKCHRLFSVEDGMFISATDMVGKTTYTESGESKVLSCELTQEKVEFYNIITHYHINLFANGVLASCRYNNIYPIQDMKFIKDDRMNRAPKWKLYEQFRDYKCLGRYIEGMRLYEQLNIPLENTIKYCEKLESLRKSLDEFEGNEKILKKIEDTEVGWIDRNGNIYGFKHYMPGQYNHIILSEKICKELNVQTDNPSRYLEKLGWVKYTTDFIINSNDEYINKNQLDVIKTFIQIPGKLKSEGYIKIGSIFDTPINISEFENMDEYSFEFRKQNSRKIWQREK